MAKSKIKYLIVLMVLIVLIAIPILTYAEPISYNIAVYFNRISIEVNGVKVEADNILYNGTTYVPLRKVAEMLNKDVEWKADLSTACITDKIEEPITYVGSKDSDKYHLPTCRFVERIDAANLIEFKSALDAKRKGYKPCSTCLP